MKKVLLILAFSLLGGLQAHAQTDPISFFQKAFTDLKTGNVDEFVNQFISNQQYNDLLNEHLRKAYPDEKSLISTPASGDSTRISWLKKRFNTLRVEADSLNIDFSKADYVDCRFEEVKDPRALRISLRGIIYFDSNGKNYQWMINEAVLIKAEWKILSMGRLSEGSNAEFETAKPDGISAFGSTTKVKVTKVILSPPPPIHVPIPPPPDKQ